MTEFTVVLLRPDYLCEVTGEKYGKDIYVALVTAQDARSALVTAQKEVFAADKEDGMEPSAYKDYELCVMFNGHCDVRYFGWQVF